MLTIENVLGAPTWLELGSPDVAASAAFYGELFGWRHQSAGLNSGGYGFFTLDAHSDQVVAAVGPLGDGETVGNWSLYFHTPDVNATVARAEAAGGTVAMAPDDVFTAGRMAIITDPTGAEFSLWQPGDITGLDLVNEPGSLIWTELYTTDAITARTFYRDVLGWVEISSPASGPSSADGGYVVVAPMGGTGPRDAHGGILQLAEEHLAAGSGSEWHPYIAVTDCDAVLNTAIKNGASALIPPMELEGVGRLAMFADPSGAPCAVITGSVDGTS